MTPPILTAFTRHAAKAVVTGQMDYYEAESSIAYFLPSIGYQDYDAAFDLLSKAIARYEAEAARLARAIRSTARTMFNRHCPSEEIKKAASLINKFNFLAETDVQEVLRTEYIAWKAARPQIPDGSMIMPPPRPTPPAGPIH